MKVRFDRIERIQAALRERGWIAIVVLNHDDYRYLFGTDRAQVGPAGSEILVDYPIDPIVPS